MIQVHKVPSAEGRPPWIGRHRPGNRGLQAHQGESWSTLAHMFYKGIRGEIDVFAFTSSMWAKSFIDEAKKHYTDEEVEDMLDCAIIAAIGEPTQKTLEDPAQG